MVSFIYLAWGAMMQLEMIANTGAMRFTVWTTGTPMVIALLFYGLKRLAMFIREQLELEQYRKEHPQ
jgi:hypothetical protein